VFSKQYFKIILPRFVVDIFIIVDFDSPHAELRVYVMTLLGGAEGLR
jgi:hypothetical protein